MKCYCCEEIIRDDEYFYEINNQIYCENCVEEETYYKVGFDDELVHESRVNYYSKKSGYINDLNKYIEIYKRDLEYYSKRSDEISKKRVESLEKRVHELKEQKKKVLNEMENGDE